MRWLDFDGVRRCILPSKAEFQIAATRAQNAHQTLLRNGALTRCLCMASVTATAAAAKQLLLRQDWLLPLIATTTTAAMDTAAPTPAAPTPAAALTAITIVLPWFHNFLVQYEPTCCGTTIRKSATIVDIGGCLSDATMLQRLGPGV